MYKDGISMGFLYETVKVIFLRPHSSSRSMHSSNDKSSISVLVEYPEFVFSCRRGKSQEADKFVKV